MRYVLQNHFRDNSSFFSEKERRVLWNGNPYEQYPHLHTVEPYTPSESLEIQYVDDPFLAELDAFPLPPEKSNPPILNIYSGVNEQAYALQTENQHTAEARFWDPEKYNSILNSEAAQKNERFKTKETPHYSRGGYYNVSAPVFDTIKTFTPSEVDSEGFSERNHFASLITEDGVTFPELKKTWNKGIGVLRADHSAKTLQNTSIQEWKKSASNERISRADIAEFEKQLQTDKVHLRKQKDQMHKESFNDFKALSPAAQSSITSLSNTLPLIQEFNNSGYTTQMDPDRSFFPTKLQAETEIQVLAKILREKKINGTNLSSEQITYLKRYNVVLEYTLEIRKLDEENNILQGIKNHDHGSNVPVKIDQLINGPDGIEETKKKLKDLKSRDPLNKDKIEELERKLEAQKDRLSFYKSYLPEYRDLHPGSGLYQTLFNEEGEIKQPEKAIKELDKYYEWIKQQIWLEGVPRPQNHDVAAVLIAGAYRGEFSPTKLQVGLKRLVDREIRGNAPFGIQGFYDGIGEILNGGGTNASQSLFSNQNILAAFGDSLAHQMYSSSINWTAPEFIGNKHPEGNQGAMERNHIVQDSAFQNKWGFSIGNAYYRWKNLQSMQVDPISYDAQGNVMQYHNALPLAGWINNGQVNNSPAMKNFLLQIIPTQFNPQDQSVTEVYRLIESKQWNGSEPALITFVTTLQDKFTQYEKVTESVHFQNTAQGSAEFIKSVKGTLGDSVWEKFEYMGEELMDGNMMYWGFLGAMLVLGSKFKPVQNMALWGGAIALGNSVAKDLTGFDLMDETLYLLKGNTKRQASNPASWSMVDMKDGKHLEDSEFSYDELERAGTALGQANLNEVLEWYNHCKKNLASNDPELVGKTYKNDSIPSGLKKNLGFIFEGQNSKNTQGGEKAAHVAFEYFDRYLKHLSVKHDASLSIPSAGKGFQYLSDNYINVDQYHINYKNSQKKYAEEGVEKKGYRLEEVIAQETDLKTIQRMTVLSSPLMNMVGEWSNEAITFISVHLVSEFGDQEKAMAKLKEIKNDIVSWGWKWGNLIGDEMTFWDNTGNAWKVIKSTAGDGWEVVKKGAKATDNWVKQNTGASFKEAWEWVSTNTSDGLKWIGDSIKGLNALVLGADLNATVVPNGGFTDLKATVLNIGIENSIMNTYGIDSRSNLDKFLERASNDPDVQMMLEDIADSRGSNVIEAQDIVMYFFGSYGYGVGTAIQTGIDIVEFISSIGNQALQGVVGVVSDDAKAFLMEYDPSKLARIFPRDDIEGRAHFRNFIAEESQNSIASGVDINWTSDTLRTYSDRKIQEIFNGATLNPHSPISQYIITFFDTHLRVSINNRISSLNTGLPPALQIPLLSQWEFISSTKKENAITFTKNALQREFADHQFRVNFISSIPAPATQVAVDNKIRDHVIEKIKNYDWTI